MSLRSRLFFCVENKIRDLVQVEELFLCLKKYN